MSDWQPIDTAPKDATSILLGGPGWVAPATWDDTLEGTVWGGTWTMASKPPSPPMHWMPLPAPPNGLAGTCGLTIEPP